MSSNPNLQKIGKRKNAGPKQQADWLFPSTEKNASTTTAKSQPQGRSTNKQDKQLAKDLLKRRADGTSKAEPPSQLMAIVSIFLSENEFGAAAAAALQTEHRVSGLNGGDTQDMPSLTTIYNEWLALKAESSIPDAKAKLKENGKANKNMKQAKGEKKKTRVQESDASDVEMVDAPSSSSSSSSSSFSSSSSSSDSDADDEKEVVKTSPKSKPNTLKRKAASSSSESSTSDSDDSDSSSEDEAPRSKKMKMKAPSSSETSENDSTDSSSETSSSSSDSSSEDDDESSTTSLAQKTPLPDSETSSSDDTDDESSSASSKQPALASESSATLNDSAKESSSSSEPSSDSSSSSDSDAEPKQAKVIKKFAATVSPPLPPDPVVKKPFKKTNVPFSRIPADIKVDERLASNAYVPYDYAQKAHEDLIVTRGKGFTKEKNKKKRGSYRGGYIDVEGKKGIKFED